MFDRQWIANTVKIARANLTKCETLLCQGDTALRKAVKLHGLERSAALETCEIELSKMVACEQELRQAIAMLGEQRAALEFAAKNSIEVA